MLPGFVKGEFHKLKKFRRLLSFAAFSFILAGLAFSACGYYLIFEGDSLTAGVNPGRTYAYYLEEKMNVTHNYYPYSWRKPFYGAQIACEYNIPYLYEDGREGNDYALLGNGSLAFRNDAYGGDSVHFDAREDRNMINQVGHYLPMLEGYSGGYVHGKWNSSTESYEGDEYIENDGKPAYFFLLGGTNDLMRSSFDAQTVMEDIRAISEYALSNGVPVVLMTVPPRWDYRERVAALNELIREYTTEDSHVILVDMFSILYSDDDDGWKDEYYKDGVHPNAAGYEAIANAIWEEVFYSTSPLDPPADTGSIFGCAIDANTRKLLGGMFVDLVNLASGNRYYGYTRHNGNYEVTGLPTGEYLVYVSTDGTSYVPEYYKNAYNPEDATPVIVTTGNTTPEINFELAEEKNTDGSSSGGGGGGCFIATAVYGTETAEEVVLLKKFRDEHLMKNLPGRAFVKFYYRYSPAFADYLRRHNKAKTVVRAALNLLVRILR